MNFFLQRTVVASILLLVVASTAFGGWKADVTTNQLRAKQYIAKLKAGEYPDSLTRPRLKRNKTWKSKQSRKEILEAMNEAEALARAGKPHLIEEPVFQYNGLTDEKDTELQGGEQKSRY